MPKPKFIQELKVTPPTKDIKGAVAELVKRKSPIVITDLNDAKVLISRVIYNLQADKKIDIVKAKAILYATGVYI